VLSAILAKGQLGSASAGDDEEVACARVPRLSHVPAPRR
jgi:hypothetical protein